MNSDEKTLQEKLDSLDYRIDKIEKTIYRIEADTIAINKQLKELTQTLHKHINFIDKTYEGLKNPIEGVKRWLGR